MNIHDIRERLSANADKYTEEIKGLERRLKIIEENSWKSFLMKFLPKNNPKNIRKELQLCQLRFAEYQKAVQGIDHVNYLPAVELMDKIVKSIKARGFIDYGFYPPPALGSSAIEARNVLVDAQE